MRTIFYSVIFFFVIFVVSVSCSSSNKNLCHDYSLACAKHNFSELYVKNYNRFWNIFHTAEKEAVSCKSVDKTAEFLEFASVKKGNSEFNEYFMDVVENQIISKNPKCFLDAMVLTSMNSREIIFAELKNPLFVEKPMLNNLLKPFVNDPKYRDILDDYFTTE